MVRISGKRMAMEKKELQEKLTEVTFDDFLRMDLRIGKILEVIPVPNSKKLMRIIADFSTEKKQAVAGLLHFYKPENLDDYNCPPECYEAHVRLSRSTEHKVQVSIYKDGSHSLKLLD